MSFNKVVCISSYLYLGDVSEQGHVAYKPTEVMFSPNKVYSYFCTVVQANAGVSFHVKDKS